MRTSEEDFFYETGILNQSPVSLCLPVSTVVLNVASREREREQHSSATTNKKRSFSG